jgi:hypothetical protein
MSIVAIIIAIFLSISNKQQMVTIQKGNIQHKPIDIKLHKYQDSQCGMVIDSIEYASEVISPDGKTWFFHDHGGMIKWLEPRPFKKEAIIWVHALDTNRWIDVMPYIEVEYYNKINTRYSYEKITQSDSFIAPKTKTHYNVYLTTNNLLSAECSQFDTLENALDTCASILESKEFYSYFKKTPTFQKAVWKNKKKLTDTLGELDHRKYFFDEDIYCE